MDEMSNEADPNVNRNMSTIKSETENLETLVKFKDDPLSEGNLPHTSNSDVGNLGKSLELEYLGADIKLEPLCVINYEGNPSQQAHNLPLKDKASIADWNVEDVCDWLNRIHLGGFKQAFIDNEIDGETLLALTERMTERLFPTIKKQVIFLKALEEIKRENEANNDNPPLTPASSIEDESGPSCQPEARVNLACPPFQPDPLGMPPCQPELRDNLASPLCQLDPLINLSCRTCQPEPTAELLGRFPPCLQQALRNQDERLTSRRTRIRDRLIQVLFEQLSQVTMYPSHKQYFGFLSNFVANFPFMREKNASGFESLHQSIRNKFKKERPNQLLQHDEVIRRKQKYSSSQRKRKAESQDP